MKRLLAAFLLSTTACGTSGALPSPTPTASVAPSATPRAIVTPVPTPKRVPGSLVRVSVGGVDQPDGIVRAPSDAPMTVVLSFPFDVDRASVERFLSKDLATSWTDDRTLSVTVPPANERAFKIAEVGSRDGLYTIDYLVVSVSFPPVQVVNVYASDDLATFAGDARQPPLPVASWRVHAGYIDPRRGSGTLGPRLSPDARSLLIVDALTAPPANAAAPRLIDVTSDTVRTLAVPAADGPFSYVGWLVDGRLLFVGKKAWIGDARGDGMRLVADLTASDGWPLAAAPSRDGRVALWYELRLMTLDLGTGVFRRVNEMFRPCAFRSAPMLTWSADGRFLAGTDCEPTRSAQLNQRVKIVDVGAGRTAATLDGEVYRLSTFPTGELLVVGPSAETGQGAHSLGRILGFDASEKARYLGCFWQGSPDGRYVLSVENCGPIASEQGTHYALIDRRTGTKSRPFFLPHNLTWLADGRLAAF